VAGYGHWLWIGYTRITLPATLQVALVSEQIASCWRPA